MNNAVFTVLGLTALSFSKSMGSAGEKTKLFKKEYPLLSFERMFSGISINGFLNQNNSYTHLSNNIKKIMNDRYLEKYNFRNIVKVEIVVENVAYLHDLDEDSGEHDITLVIHSFVGIPTSILDLAEKVFVEAFTSSGVTFVDNNLYKKWQLVPEKIKTTLLFKGNPTNNLNDLIDQWYDLPLKKPSKLRRR